MLGVSRHATKAEVHAAWLKKVKENHPDHLIAKRASEEKIAEANATIAAPNTSYQRIMEDMKKP